MPIISRLMSILALLSVVLWGTALTSCQQRVKAAKESASGQVTEVEGAAVEAERTPNALINEKSVYLQQHTYNEVYWYPWGEEALERAQSEDKLVFLSIGYSSCHWCHVMEEEVFEDEMVGDYLNENYICIKVDREERPDLDAVYMDAMLTMLGRGGWPLNMFLTPDLKPIFGATYMPKAEFLATSRRIIQLYQEDREALLQAGNALVEHLAEEPRMDAGGEFRLDDMKKVIDETRMMFDENWGGLMADQKFPTPVRWQFMLHFYRKTGDKSAGQMLRKTLDRMSDGGLKDQLGGGFHRYTVDREWVVPHFEKMLYDNAQLASLFAEASTVFADEGYAATARQTLDFMVDELSDGQGFYASFDADSGGEEGTFYVWTPDEIIEVAGEDDGPALVRILGATKTGNFEGANVLTLRVESSEQLEGLDPDTAAAGELLAKWRDTLLQYRAKRIAPGLDRKVVTAWNGLAISALARGYMRFGDEGYLQAAESAADYLADKHRMQDGGLARSSTDGVASGAGVLDDYAMLATGLLDLYSAGGDIRHLDRSLELIDHALARFSREAGGFYFTSTDTEAPLGRKFQAYDSVEPSGNSAMAQALLRAAAFTGDPDYYAKLDSMFSTHSTMMKQAGIEMSCLLDAALLSAGPYYDVVIAGSINDGVGAEMLAVYNSMIPCNSVLARIGADGPDESDLVLLPPLAGKIGDDDGQPLAYVCVHGACKIPASSAAQLKEQLLDGWTY